MLRVFGSQYQNCDGLSRRNFLELGAPLLGLGLADVLALRAAGANTKQPNEKPRGGKSLIVFWTHGGMSQQDTYDMKPDAPAEYRGMYQAIDTTVPGIVLGERFAQQAKVMKHISLVRSVHHENGIHAPSAHWMQTGHFGPTLARNAAKFPSFGSVIARTNGAHGEHMPPYVTIPKSEAFGYQGAVYLGKAYNPFEVNADPNAKNFKVANLAPPSGLTLKSVESRRRLLKKFDTLRRDIDSSGLIEGLDTFKAQALEMVSGERVREAFNLSAEPDKLRDRYGRHQYGQSALLARRLVEAGSSCVTINTGYWDHHNDIEKGLETHLPPLDVAMAALIEDLDQRGMLDDVVVYCAGEFGRTPLMNGHAGRDHWSNCFTTMLAGGGLKGGQIVGASEKFGGGVRERQVMPLDLLATIYQAMGISLDTYYIDSTGRPTNIVSPGQPIHELL
ncbi:MAG: DUF1501 domain-containing protein [Planctomycetaceae bacterium]|jgi:uncharacterized protein (DUF1501 family)|nr:DUF1501 domain-containing protein [Planctomycetaceae bacterium]MBT6485853.1 DUF1501 domain-containing protein [Planctomycetaceae bacterium]MBT6495520.1 DUF1501 domain-containing protein [Planctomycetaceae bacterium]